MDANFGIEIERGELITLDLSHMLQEVWHFTGALQGGLCIPSVSHM